MEIFAKPSKAAKIPFSVLDSERTWDASLFLGGWISAVSDNPGERELGSIADVFEGERAAKPSAAADSAPTYRAGSVTSFELVPEPGDWRSSFAGASRSVQPGDVIVKRVAPIMAAVVSVEVPSLGVDGNLFIVRGLSEVEAWWVAFCLNHPACADYLISKSGRGVLSRVSLSVLREWTPPQAPASFATLARRLADLLAKRGFLASQFAALEEDVEDQVSDLADTDAYEKSERHFAASSWSFFFPAALTDQSWLPVHVATVYRSDVLRRDSDWRVIQSFLMPDTPPRKRFASAEDPIRVLRLGDISDIPVVPDSLPEQVPGQINRVFSHPVEPEDVLLSTLGSSPRVAFTPASLDEPVYAVDHWERLHFRSHAGAYVLILRSTPILHQLRALATGSVQQFIRPDDIQRLYLPVIPDETLTRWDRSFRGLTKSWAQTSTDWSATLHEGWRSFAREFPGTPLASTPK